jgi:hypothetical protein
MRVASVTIEMEGGITRILSDEEDLYGGVFNLNMLVYIE